MTHISRNDHMKRQKHWVLGLFLLFVCLLPMTASAQEEKKVVRMGYYENENFQAGASDDLVKTGYSYEYMRRLQTYTNWEYEYVYGEYGDLYQMLVDGDIDLLTGLAFKEDRVGIIGYPDLAQGDTPYAFLKRTDETEITSKPATIEGKKIGVVEGAMENIVNQYLEDNKITAQMVVFSDLEARDQALLDGDVDITIVEGNGTSAEDGVEAFAQAGATDYYVVTNIKRPDILEDLNKAQTEMFANSPNQKSQLNARWFRTNAVSATISEDERTWLANHKIFTVGFFNDYLPFSATDEKGAVTGVIKDIVPEIFRVLGADDVKIKYRGYDSYEDILEALNTGEVDASFPTLVDYWANEKYGLMPTESVFSSYYNLIYSGDYPDMETAKIALRTNNATVQEFVTVEYPNAQIIPYDTVEACMDAVVSGEVDATLLNGHRTSYYMRVKDDYNTLTSAQLPGEAQLGFAALSTNHDTLNILSHGIELMDPDFALTHSYQYEMTHKVSTMEFIQDNIWLPILVVILLGGVIITFILRELHKNKAYLAQEKKQKEELEKAKVAAEAASQAKSTFLFNMSHDIRTPLNAILGFTELAGKEPENLEKAASYRKKVEVASHQLLYILDNVLEMSRIESHRMDINEELVDAQELVSDCTTIFEDEAQKKQLTLSTKCDVQHNFVYADKTHLTEIFMNLVSNAIKFTPDGGKIEVSVRELPGERPGECIMESTVKDNGIGMSEEYQKQIFDEFSRERTSSQSGIQGTGLGMAIVKRLVDLMSGTITMNSEVGKGTEFIVLLPHRIGEAPTQEGEKASGAALRKSRVDAVVSDVASTSSSMETMEDSSAAAAQETEPQSAAAPVDFTGKRILLAEDVDVNALLAMEIVKMQGFAVDRAKNGQECLNLLTAADEGYYDLILMDIQMPVMDGYEATRAIRGMADPKKSNLPIVALSANAFKEDIDKSLEAGMNAHLAKPIDMKQMADTLAGLLG